MSATYSTKTQKKRALESIHAKAFKLLGSSAISMHDFTKLDEITKRALRKL